MGNRFESGGGKKAPAGTSSKAGPRGLLHRTEGTFFTGTLATGRSGPYGNNPMFRARPRPHDFFFFKGRGEKKPKGGVGGGGGRGSKSSPPRGIVRKRGAAQRGPAGSYLFFPGEEAHHRGGGCQFFSPWGRFPTKGSMGEVALGPKGEKKTWVGGAGGGGQNQTVSVSLIRSQQYRDKGSFPKDRAELGVWLDRNSGAPFEKKGRGGAGGATGGGPKIFRRGGGLGGGGPAEGGKTLRGKRGAKGGVIPGGKKFSFWAARLLTREKENFEGWGRGPKDKGKKVGGGGASEKQGRGAGGELVRHSGPPGTGKWQREKG